MYKSGAGVPPYTIHHSSFTIHQYSVCFHAQLSRYLARAELEQL